MANVTQQMIADRLGVTRAAVSLALRGDINVSEALRKKVRAVADELGYVVNPFVAANMAHVRNGREPKYKATLVYLQEHPDEDESWLAIELSKGVRERAESLGYSLMDMYLSDGLSAARRTQILLSRGIYGVVYKPPVVVENEDVLCWSKFAVSLVGHTWPESSFHRSTHYNFRVVTDIAAKLRAMGHRRIGLALPADAAARGNQFALAAYLLDQHLNALGTELEPLVPEDWSKERFLRWFEEERPEAIITSAGWRAREWLGVTGEREPCIASTCWIPKDGGLCGVELNSRGVGAGAIDLVIGQLHRNERGESDSCKVMLINGVWREQGTPVSADRGSVFQQPG